MDAGELTEEDIGALLAELPPVPDRWLARAVALVGGASHRSEAAGQDRDRVSGRP